MTVIDKTELGKRLAYLPGLLGINSRQIAITIGADPSYYSRAEKGKGISLNYIDALIEKFNLSKSWLVLGEGQPIRQISPNKVTIADPETAGVQADPIIGLPVSDKEKLQLYHEKIVILLNEIDFWKRINQAQQQIIEGKKSK